MNESLPFKGFTPDMVYESNYFCFRKCVNSFKEKPLSPYDRECMFACLQNQYALIIELQNQEVNFLELKSKESI